MGCGGQTLMDRLGLDVLLWQLSHTHTHTLTSFPHQVLFSLHHLMSSLPVSSVILSLSFSVVSLLACVLLRDSLTVNMVGTAKQRQMLCVRCSGCALYRLFCNALRFGSLPLFSCFTCFVVVLLHENTPILLISLSFSPTPCLNNLTCKRKRHCAVL